MTRPSLGIACTFRDEVNALPGFLEMATAFADHVFLADCSYDMSPSTDGSLDIIRKWGFPDPPRWDLSEGFGAVRSQLVHSCPTDWVIIMDCDERLGIALPEIGCIGTEAYPEVQNPNLIVTNSGVTYNHRDLIYEMIVDAEQRGLKAVRFSRRHWFKPGFTSPTQNFMVIRDHQLRCMKARSGIGFTTKPRMHERAYDFDRNREPDYLKEDDKRGPWFDHYHCFFKPMEAEQRREDIRVYDMLDKSDRHTPIPA